MELQQRRFLVRLRPSNPMSLDLSRSSVPDSVTFRIASPEVIRRWTSGKVHKWEFRKANDQPVEGGIFDERIFGRLGWRVCKCSSRQQPPGPADRCEKCLSLFRPARAELMGRIELAAKVAHPWFYRQSPNYIALALGDPSSGQNSGWREHPVSGQQKTLSRFEQVLLGRLEVVIHAGNISGLSCGKILEPEEAETLRKQQGGKGFRCGTGGDAIHRALAQINLPLELEKLKEAQAQASARERKWLSARLGLLEGFLATNTRPEWMMLSILAVEPVAFREEGGGESEQGLPNSAWPPKVSLFEEYAKLYSLQETLKTSQASEAELLQVQEQLIEVAKHQRLREKLASPSYLPSVNQLYRNVIQDNEELWQAIKAPAATSILRQLSCQLQERVDQLIGPSGPTSNVPSKGGPASSAKGDHNSSSRRAQHDANAEGAIERSIATEPEPDEDDESDPNDAPTHASRTNALAGKAGLLRKNLLGKRVNFSGRSVIVPGPELQLHQCGLPREIALRVFWPFILAELLRTESLLRWLEAQQRAGNFASFTIASALTGLLGELDKRPETFLSGLRAVHKSLVEEIRFAALAGDGDAAANLLLRLLVTLPAFTRKYPLERLQQHRDPLILTALDAVVARKPLLLVNRQPSLHRPSIQAFEPVLIDGQAIAMHPLVCAGFNADFDGDTVAVHLPLSSKAQQEARSLMMTGANLLKPASGELLAMPSQDMVLGCHYLTADPVPRPFPGRLPFLASAEEVRYAYECGPLKVHDTIRLAESEWWKSTDPEDPDHPWIVTTVGRVLFNDLLPTGTPFFNEPIGKQGLRQLLERILQDHGGSVLVQVLERLKTAGFDAATQSGISMGIDDICIPANKRDLVEETARKCGEVEGSPPASSATTKGLGAESVKLWLECMEKLKELVRATLKSDFRRHGAHNPLSLILESEARCSKEQVVQLAGMRGLMVRQDNSYALLPIRSNFREGLSIPEYFTSTYGARKGLIDSALRTPAAGYFTRKLAHLVHDVRVTMQDCGTKEGLIVDLDPDRNPDKCRAAYLVGRFVARGHSLPADVLADMGGGSTPLLYQRLVERILAVGIGTLKVRSVLSCQAPDGVCAKCYGMRLHDSQPSVLGDAVGLIAAQSLGEPTTQLTLRTFHLGGSASRTTASTHSAGKPQHDDITTAVRQLEKLLSHKEPAISKMTKLDYVTNGHAESGQNSPKLTRSNLGTAIVQRVKEIRAIYQQNDANVDPKHVELVLREMFASVRVSDAGDTGLVTSVLVPRLAFDEANDRSVAKGQREAAANLIAVGINSQELHIDKPLVAAGSGRASKHLAAAAVKGRVEKLDSMRGQVMAGGLIPVGTGFRE